MLQTSSDSLKQNSNQEVSYA